MDRMIDPTPLRRFLSFAVVAIAISAPAPVNAQYGDEFPVADGLRPTIDFWKNVFAVWSENEIVTHDRDDLSIVYRVDFQRRSDEAADRKRNESEQEAIKHRIRTILLDLAERNPDPRTLAGEYRTVYEAFGPGAGPERWRQAADRIRIQRGLKERFRTGLRRAGQYQDHIEEIFDDEDVPEELAWLPMIETTYTLNARSSVGAAGAWQFMPSTGRLYMRVDRTIDERFDPIIAARGAARLLKYNYEQIGSWPLAITAYNHGLGGMKRAVREMGTDDYYTIHKHYRGPRFGFASMNFYPEFIAALEVIDDAEEYFGVVEPMETLEFDVVTVPATMPLDDIAAALGLEPRELWSLNLSLTNAVRTGQRSVPQGFALRVPEDYGDEAPVQLASAASARGQRTRTVGDAQYYTVQRGDTLSLIAARHGTTVSALLALNDIDDRHHIQVGQRLRITS